ncbi:MAG: hypothetical protein U0704_13875 [Candidatus Eisenbacteria bacterium]
MSDKPVSREQEMADAAEVESLAKYLESSREMVERLQQLREGVHDTLNEQFQIVTCDLEQLRGLLGDAAGKLSSTFRVITAGTTEMGATLDALACPDPGPALARIREITTEMTSTTGTTIQSLQFEDMATQLLAHVNRRLDALQQFSKEMAILNAGTNHLPPFLTREELDSAFESLARHRNLLQNDVRKAVQQQSLDSGDIELF